MEAFGGFALALALLIVRMLRPTASASVDPAFYRDSIIAGDQTVSVSVGLVSRNGQTDAFHLRPCVPKNETDGLARRRYCELLRGVLRACRCECRVGTVAFPNRPACLPLKELDGFYGAGDTSDTGDTGAAELRTSLRYFNPLSTVELKIPNCAADDASLLHLDRASASGWKDFIGVDIRVFSFLDQSNGLPRR